jgi:anti-sigma-K factor RskA
MTPIDAISDDFGGDDLLAAEYVVGTLPAAERQAVSNRIDTEQPFARRVNDWVRRLSALDSAYAEVEAPAGVKAAVDRRLFPSTGNSATQGAGLWSSLAFWRGLATASLAALVIAVGANYVRQPVTPGPQPQLVASLAADGSAVHFLAVYNPQTGTVGLSHVAGDRGTGKDFELWMIEGQNVPVSMGVIPVGASTHLTVDETSRAKLAAGAVLAISLEPTGGSPTGQPTGPVVAAGDLKSI